MNILIVHEMDWLKTVVFEPHYVAELLSLHGNKVFVIDCKFPNFRELIKHLRTEKSDVHRIYSKANLHLIRPKTVSLPGVYRAIAFLTHPFIIEQTLKNEKIDVVLLYSAPTNGYHALRIAKMLGIPVVFRSIDVMYALQKSVLRRKITKFFEERIYRRADRILPVTSEMAIYSKIMGAAKEKIRVCPLGVDREIFSPNNTNPLLRKQLGIKDSDLVIIFVGTLYHFSGLEYIIRNFHILGEDSKMIVVGGGPMFENYKRILNEMDYSDRIIMQGFKNYSEVPHYINISDICISPFDIIPETDRIIPIKIMEYLSCGKPVVSTPLKGAKEWLPGEQAGVIYASSGDEFLDATKKLIESQNLREELGTRGREYIQRFYDWHAVIQNIIREIQDVIPNNMDRG